MEKEFVPYDESLALKELGFDRACMRGWYKNLEIWYHPNSDIILDNPTFSQAFRWFKEKYKLMSCITPCSDGEYIFTLYDLNKCDLEVFVEDIEIMESEDSYEFFEEAELECLKKLIEIVKLSHKTASI